MTEIQPLVSVIIPTYKRPETIKRAIDSVISQTYSNIEIIVVDDNSEYTEARTKTKTILSKYPSIKYIQNNKNLGGAKTRNIGIDAAKGQFVAFLDDDDEFLPNKIELQVTLMLQKKEEDNKTCIIYCYQNNIYKNSKKNKVKKAKHCGNALFEHILNFTMPTSTWLCDKEIIQKLGCFDDIPSQQDLSLMLKILDAGYSIYYVPKALLNFYVHDPGKGITKNGYDFVEQVKNYQSKCRKSFDKLTPRQIKKIEHNFHNRLCNCYIQIPDIQMAKQELRIMFRTRPFSLPNYKNTVKLLLAVSKICYNSNKRNNIGILL